MRDEFLFIFKSFLMWTIFKVFIEDFKDFIEDCNIASVSCFGSLGKKHV